LAQPREAQTVENEPRVGEAELRAAERYVEQEEGAVSRFRGALGAVTTALLVVMSL
jgi:hypothetical protein